MSHILIAYASSEGQTASVADHVATVATEAGHEVTSYEIEDIPRETDPADFDGVLVGASIHVGKHQKRARRFVADHVEALGAVPSGFFQVSLSSGIDDEEAQAEAAEYVENLVDATGWHPDRVGLFGGALKFSEYGWLKRRIMRTIARQADLGDVSEDVVFTDFDAVTAFATDFLDFVASERAGEAEDTERAPDLTE